MEDDDVDVEDDDVDDEDVVEVDVEDVGLGDGWCCGERSIEERADTTAAEAAWAKPPAKVLFIPNIWGNCMLGGNNVAPPSIVGSMLKKLKFKKSHNIL